MGLQRLQDCKTAKLGSKQRNKPVRGGVGGKLDWTGGGKEKREDFSVWDAGRRHRRAIIKRKKGRNDQQESGRGAGLQPHQS